MSKEKTIRKKIGVSFCYNCKVDTPNKPEMVTKRNHATDEIVSYPICEICGVVKEE